MLGRGRQGVACVMRSANRWSVRARWDPVPADAAPVWELHLTTDRSYTCTVDPRDLGELGVNPP